MDFDRQILLANLAIDIGFLLIALGGFIVAIARLKAVHDDVQEIKKASFAKGVKAQKEQNEMDNW